MIFLGSSTSTRRTPEARTRRAQNDRERWWNPGRGGGKGRAGGARTSADWAQSGWVQHTPEEQEIQHMGYPLQLDPHGGGEGDAAAADHILDADSGNEFESVD